jgi:hypothetical protein
MRRLPSRRSCAFCSSASSGASARVAQRWPYRTSRSRVDLHLPPHASWLRSSQSSWRRLSGRPKGVHSGAAGGARAYGWARRRVRRSSTFSVQCWCSSLVRTTCQWLVDRPQCLPCHRRRNRSSPLAAPAVYRSSSQRLWLSLLLALKPGPDLGRLAHEVHGVVCAANAFVVRDLRIRA